jgi:hypothetical protein
LERKKLIAVEQMLSQKIIKENFSFITDGKKEEK